MSPKKRDDATREVRISKDLGARLRQARERKGFTVRGLARYVGVSPSLVSQVERGRVMPSVGTLYSIANQLEKIGESRTECPIAGNAAHEAKVETISVLSFIYDTQAA